MQLKGAFVRALRRLAPLGFAVLGVFFGAASRPDVLPDDRADALGTYYTGGGQDITGVSFLVRKKVGDHVSLAYNHLEDIVSGASIDVRTSGASPYREKRTQNGLSAEILAGKTTYSLGVTHSYEPDYRSNSATFGISQSMFGDLTTVSLSYRRTWNDVYKMECAERNASDGCEAKIHDPSFGEKDMDERSYGVGITQILTRNSIIAANFEVITDQGWISNPYRSVMYLNPSNTDTFLLQAEVDPNTRTSNALGLDYKYFLPWRAALDAQYRFFQDTWHIRAHTAQIGYSQPWHNWTFDGSARFYTQTHADFYSDLFARPNELNFESRNRELSSFNEYTIGAGAAYQFQMPHAPWISKSTANIRFDHFIFDYKDFRDAESLLQPGNTYAAGTEPLYTVQLNVMQVFLSVYY